MINLAHRLLLRIPDPEMAHNLLTWAVRILNHVPFLMRFVANGYRLDDPHRRSFTWRGIRFKHRVGMAAGFDKQGYLIFLLQLIGFASVEVGTVLPRLQKGNPKPRVFRLPEFSAIVNRMGFNSLGADVVRKNLVRLVERLDIVVGISLGKMKETDNKNAWHDYVSVLDRLAEFAHYVAVNVSSPNTPDLRKLQGAAYIEELVRKVGEHLRTKLRGKDIPPILVKVDPDSSDEETVETIEAAIRGGAEGVIIANTSVNSKLHAGQETGGVSGAPIHEKACRKIRFVRNRFPSLFIIGAGGNMTKWNVANMRRAGADFIQLYSGFIYNGPPLIRESVEWLDKEGLA